MNWLVYHIASGHSFFTGILLIVCAVFASTQTRPMFRRVTTLAFLAGTIAVALSSTAIPYWHYAIATLATAVWIASHYKKAWRRWSPHVAIGAWIIAALIEVPYHITPSLAPASDRGISIIGDSVTAGIGGDENSETWPSILARDHQLHVQDISHMGETAASALKRAKSRQISSSVVIVEIGGNDILGSTTSEQFANDLEELLACLAVPGRQVVMFELPLPPFSHEYGRVQRAVAARHNVRLIPKRVFLSVIAGSESTLDTIHLSQSGHQLMADTVWRVLQSAFDPDIAA